MIRIVYADQADKHPELFASMYRDRASQFRDRLGWNVKVDERGFETDVYDLLNPMYLIAEAHDGTHLGSMRFLPTTGDTMINDHFTEITGGVTVKSPFIWESTRFCLAPNASRSVSRKVLLGTLELGLHFGVQFFVGVFSRKMCRIYERIGWSPVVVGEGTIEGDDVLAGLWPISEAARMGILARHNSLQALGESLEFSLGENSVVSEEAA